MRRRFHGCDFKMKVTNGLFIICMGLLIIMFSPKYGSDRQANPVMLIIGLIIAFVGGITVFIRLKQDRKNKKDGEK